MPVDPNIAVGLILPEQEFVWTRSDVVSYRLALTTALDWNKFGDSCDQDPQVIPTFGMTAPAIFGVAAPNLSRAEPPEIRFPGVEIHLASVLHGQQTLVVHQPIPVHGRAMARSRIVDIYDKGTAAVIRQETRLVRSDDTPLLTATSSLFVRGEGGFGGKRGPSGSAAPVDVPHGEPDAVLDIPTQPQQALLYRLCGDRNPLHTDPLAARAAGFPGPILQGACVYGMVCQAVVTAMLDGEASRVSRYSAGFSGVVFPGETLRTRVWKFGNRFTFTTSVLERPESRVLSGGELIAHYSRIRVGALSSRQASHRYIHSNDSTQTVVRRLK